MDFKYKIQNDPQITPAEQPGVHIKQLMANKTQLSVNISQWNYLNIFINPEIKLSVKDLCNSALQEWRTRNQEWKTLAENVFNTFNWKYFESID